MFGFLLPVGIPADKPGEYFWTLTQIKGVTEAGEWISQPKILPSSVNSFPPVEAAFYWSQSTSAGVHWWPTGNKTGAHQQAHKRPIGIDMPVQEAGGRLGRDWMGFWVGRTGQWQETRLCSDGAESVVMAPNKSWSPSWDWSTFLGQHRSMPTPIIKLAQPDQAASVDYFREIEQFCPSLQADQWLKIPGRITVVATLTQGFRLDRTVHYLMH